MVVKLIVASGKNAGRSIAVKRTKLLIGRAEECDVRPLSDEVSRRHCCVTVGPGDVWVEDLGSRNGTFVNGKRIAEKTRVTDGDVVRVGSLELRVTVSDPAARAGTEGDVSRWLVDDDEPKEGAESTQTMPLDAAIPQPEPPRGEDPGVRPSPAAAKPAEQAKGPSDAGGQGAPDDSSPQMTVESLKAARTNPGGLPKDARRKADSSRDAAADALRKFFGNR